MDYITYNNLIEDIKNNLWKIPRDIDGIIAIERSGIVPAMVISQYVNIPMALFNTFLSHSSENINELFEPHGEKLMNKPKNTKKYLIIDDTVCSGKQMKEKIDTIKAIHPEFTYVSCVMYLDAFGGNRIYIPDIYLDIHNDNYVLYEWSLFRDGINNLTLYDFDGVLCYDPPSDTNILEYEKYLKNPKPKFNIITANKYFDFPINICSYRIKKYYQETVDFLIKYGYKPGQIFLFNAETIEERNKIPSYIYKAHVYQNSNFRLFVESNDYEALMINQITKRPVLSIEKNKLYK